MDQELREKNGASAARADYVYIVSLGHSGSTLLELLLGCHPRMIAMGEIDKLALQFARDHQARYPGLCSCGQRPMDCPVWGAVTAAVKREYGVDLAETPFDWRLSEIGWEEDPKKPSPLIGRVKKYYKTIRYAKYAHSRTPGLGWLARAVLNHHDWMRNRFFVAGTIKSVAGADVAIDSSKDYVSMRDVYDRNPGTTKIIFLTRDPRGVAWSQIKRPWNARDVVGQATRWVNVNRRTMRLLEGVRREDWIHLKYEELCARPVDTLKTLCAFLGQAYDPAMEQLNGLNHHTIGGNRMRFSTVLAIKEDLSWKERLTADEIAQIDRITRPLARQLGYE